jgi:hypothetical protein
MTIARVKVLTTMKCLGCLVSSLVGNTRRILKIADKMALEPYYCSSYPGEGGTVAITSTL